MLSREEVLKALEALIIAWMPLKPNARMGFPYIHQALRVSGWSLREARGLAASGADGGGSGPE